MKTGTTLITIILCSLHQRAVHSSECERIFFVCLLLDAAVLRVQMDSEHIWSGDWLSVGETRAQQN